MKPHLVTFSSASVCLLLLLLAQAGCASNKVPADNSTPAAETTGAANDGGQAAAETRQPTASEEADAQGFFKRGVEAYKQNRDAEAVEAFQQAVRLSPDFAEAHYRLGLAYDSLEQEKESDKAYEDAVSAYKKVIRKNPKDAEAHYQIGLTHDKLGKPEDAVKSLKEAAKHDPEDADKLYELALVHTKLAQFREAVSALNKVLEIDPDDYRAGEALEKAKAGMERRESFLKQQEKQDKLASAKSNKNANKNSNANTNANVSATPKTP